MMEPRSASATSDEHAKQSNLSHQTLSALFWAFSGKSVLTVLRTVTIVVLARLLAPAHFGLVAAALTVVQFSEIFALLGVGPAIVQRSQLEERHIYTGFTFSTLFGISLAGLIWLLAPGIASFYQSDTLTPILRTIVLVFPLSGLTVVAEALMHRELQFRKQAGIQVASYAIGSGGVGIGLALAGLGVWALVAAYLVQETLKAVAVLAVQPHSKKLRIEVKAFRELFYFGGGLTITKVLNYFATQGDYLVVGRWLGMEALGLYGRAYHLMATFASLLGGVLEAVLFPTMSKVQNEPERLMLAYRRGTALIWLFVLPMSTAIYVLAPELINIVLGPAWSEVVAPFRILVIGMVFRASYNVSAALAKAKGAVYRNAWRQGIYAVLVIGGAWIGQHWGIPGVALGVLVALVVHYLMMAQLGLSLILFTWRQLWFAHLPGMGCTVMIATEVWGVTSILRGVNLEPLLIVIACAAVVLMTVLTLTRFVPTYFLGADGIWMLRLLLKRLPRLRFFLSWLQKGIKQHPESVS